LGVSDFRLGSRDFGEQLKLSRPKVALEPGEKTERQKEEAEQGAEKKKQKITEAKPVSTASGHSSIYRKD